MAVPLASMRACTAVAMREGFFRIGQLVMDDITDIGDIETAGSEILLLPAHWSCHCGIAKCAVAFLLLHGAMIENIHDAALFEKGAQLRHEVALVAEYDGGAVAERTDQFEQGSRFVFIITRTIFTSSAGDFCPVRKLMETASSCNPTNAGTSTAAVADVSILFFSAGRD